MSYRGIAIFVRSWACPAHEASGFPGEIQMPSMTGVEQWEIIKFPKILKLLGTLEILACLCLGEILYISNTGKDINHRCIPARI